MAKVVDTLVIKVELEGKDQALIELIDIAADLLAHGRFRPDFIHLDGNLSGYELETRLTDALNLLRGVCDG